MMNRRKPRLTALISTLLAASLPCQENAVVEASDIQAVDWIMEVRLAELRGIVTMKVTGLRRDQLTVAMPIWKPGSYRVLNFGKAVQNVTATDAKGKALEVQVGENFTWSVACGDRKSVTFRYELPLKKPRGLHRDITPTGVGRQLALEVPPGPDGETRKVTHRDAYVFEGPATWMYIPDRLGVKQRVKFVLPEKWQVATGKEPVAGSANEFECADYDILADCPFHVGKFDRLTFEVDGVDYHVVLSGHYLQRAQQAEMKRRTELIVRAQLKMMGKPPFSHYTFLIAKSPSPFMGGGLEHLNSTNIMVPGIRGGSADGVMSHEFFHLWNVKRLRPKALGPFDYGKKVRTRYLWVAEGFTSYYGPLLNVRAGLTRPERFWTRHIANSINSLQRNPGRLKISVADTSWTVWDHPYLSRSARRKAPSYYNKGSLLGLLLDVEIRAATKGKKSLDDVVRGLYAQCMEKNSGFADGDVRKWCEKVSGRSFRDFFAKYVDGTNELPFTTTLAKIGLTAKVEERKAEGKQGKRRGGRPNRRMRPRWRVTIHKSAPEAAVQLREAMTRVVVETTPK